jgi:hypothetical protein
MRRPNHNLPTGHLNSLRKSSIQHADELKIKLLDALNDYQRRHGKAITKESSSTLERLIIKMENLGFEIQFRLVTNELFLKEIPDDTATFNSFKDLRRGLIRACQLMVEGEFNGYKEAYDFGYVQPTYESWLKILDTHYTTKLSTLLQLGLQLRTMVFIDDVIIPVNAVES